MSLISTGSISLDSTFKTVKRDKIRMQLEKKAKKNTFTLKGKSQERIKI